MEMLRETALPRTGQTMKYHFQNIYIECIFANPETCKNVVESHEKIRRCLGNMSRKDLEMECYYDVKQ